MADESIDALYAQPLVPRIDGSSKSKTIPFSSLSPGSLVLPMSTWNNSGRVNRARCQPKKRVSQFQEDQENIDPAAVCSTVAATNESLSFNKPHKSACRSPASKKHCSKETAVAAVKRKHSSIVDTLAAECDIGEMQTGSDEASTDITIKSALNCSDDRLHELIGDFSRPYCLPFIEGDKHKDLKAISCRTVCSTVVCRW